MEEGTLRQDMVTGQQWYDLMAQYARVHTASQPLDPSDLAGHPVPPHPWIGEDIHPDLGYWIAREYMYRCALAQLHLIPCCTWALEAMDQALRNYAGMHCSAQMGYAGYI